MGDETEKCIKSLVSEERVNLSNIENISKEILKFFGKLYSKPLGDSWKIEGLEWSPIAR